MTRPVCGKFFLEDAKEIVEIMGGRHSHRLEESCPSLHHPQLFAVAQAAVWGHVYEFGSVSVAFAHVAPSACTTQKRFWKCVNSRFDEDSLLDRSLDYVALRPHCWTDVCQGV